MRQVLYTQGFSETWYFFGSTLGTQYTWVSELACTRKGQCHRTNTESAGA